MRLPVDWLLKSQMKMNSKKDYQQGKNLACGHFRQSSTTQSERNNVNYNNETCTFTATASSAANMTIILDQDDQAWIIQTINVMGRKITLGPQQERDIMPLQSINILLPVRRLWMNKEATVRNPQ